MDLNKVFPKPAAVEAELARRKEDEERRAELAELARVKALAPAQPPPTISQLMAAQIGMLPLVTQNLRSVGSKFNGWLVGWICDTKVSHQTATRWTCLSPTPSSPTRSSTRR